MNKEQFNALFHARCACMLYKLAQHEDKYGWIGGNAPVYFDDKQEKVNDNGTRYYFYFTLVSPINNERMLSVFLPPFDVYNENRVYPKCSIKVFEHELSAESQLDAYHLFEEEPKDRKTNYQRNHDYSKPTINKAFFTEPKIVEIPEDRIDFVEDYYSQNEGYFLQVGGKPILIRGNHFYFENLNKEGYQFFFSVDEQEYLEDMIHGNMPLCFGAAYFFAQISREVVSNVLAGFWQN